MPFVDPDRFKRFEQFVTRNQRILAESAARGFASKGPGVVIYYAPSDRYDEPENILRFQYKTKVEIDAMHQGARDELLQGILDRYQPPGEAVIIAVYQDNTYDITRVVIQPREGGEGQGQGAETNPA